MPPVHRLPFQPPVAAQVKDTPRQSGQQHLAEPFLQESPRTGTDRQQQRPRHHEEQTDARRGKVTQRRKKQPVPGCAIRQRSMHQDNHEAGEEAKEVEFRILFHRNI